MSETALWKWFRKHIAKDGYWERIENSIGTGTPDVHFCVRGASGWIELKELPFWPKRPSTIVKIPHFTIDQRYWLSNYVVKHDGKAFLFLRIKDTHECLLFRGDQANIIGEVTRMGLINAADFMFTGPPNKKQVRFILEYITGLRFLID